MKRYQKLKRKSKIEAGRRGGIRSQQVQREKRMEIHRFDPVYPVKPRWSIGLRDNWSGESSWFTFKSFRDTMRRILKAMCLLAIPERCDRNQNLATGQYRITI
jgi:hypothetical protein